MKPHFQELHWGKETLKQLNITESPIKWINKHTIDVDLQ